MGGPPGSPAGFAEIKQIFLPKTHFTRKLFSGWMQLRHALPVRALEDGSGERDTARVVLFPFQPGTKRTIMLLFAFPKQVPEKVMF